MVSYRSEEIISVIKPKILTQALAQSWGKSSSIWELIRRASFRNPLVNASSVDRATGLYILPKAPAMEIALFAIGDLLMAYLVFFFIARQKTQTSGTVKGLTILKHALPVTSILFGALLSLYVIFHAIVPTPGIVLFNAAFLCCLFGIVVLKYFLLWLTENNSIAPRLSTALLRRTVVLCTVFLLGIAAVIIMKGMRFSEQNIALLEVLTTASILLSFFWLSWVVFSFNSIKNNCSFAAQSMMKVSLFGLYFLVIALFLAGYHNQALMILPKIVLSLCLTNLAFKLIRAFIQLQHAFDTNDRPLVKKIRAKLGFKDDEISPELTVIRYLLYFTISVLTIMGLFRLFGTPYIYLDQIHSIFFQGITVFDVTIIPVRIARGIALFFLIMLLSRFLSTCIMRSDGFKKEKHVQATISTLVRYALFMIGTVLALYIAGISFAGVAIAVGALLVGVGFGLQNIVSDFVAGLILLTNSVVKLGDYILIGGVEGVVKKIRLLSTEIRTSYPSTVLVPNSSLMNTHLVNYTDQGKVLYIRLQIAIDSIADVEIAKEIVLQVATKNTDVINNEQNKPSVLIEVYESYGKIAVHLVLNAAIPSTGNRALVLSELSSAVLNAFKQRCLQVQVSG